MRRLLIVLALLGCRKTQAADPRLLPLVKVTDVDLPGAAVRIDYQEIDATRGQLIVAHMKDNAVLFLDLATGAVRKRVTGIPTPRGVAVAPEAGLVFVTSKPPDRLVILDAATGAEIARVPTGAAPDGNAWDPVDKIVGVSDQEDGALSLIADSGRGTRKQVKLGKETGNVVYDRARGRFWITVVGPDQLVAVDPIAAKATASIALPGCSGAHGLRLHPDGASAYIACEDNNMLARVELDGKHAVVTAPTGHGPDVLAIDAGLGRLYVAAERGVLTVFDTKRPGLPMIGAQQLGEHAHTVAVDAATHRVFFPLQSGPKGTPVLRIMKPQ
jgi:DNA-binding beta-propeller fold protein YncE